jgi:hypothetical protein
MAIREHDTPTFKFIYEDTILFRESVFLVKASSREEALAKVKEDPKYSTNLKLKNIGLVDET